MTRYKCLDCGIDMLREKLPLWNEKLAEWYYVFKCPSCGSEFNHRLSKEEDGEMSRKYMGLKEYKK